MSLLAFETESDETVRFRSLNYSGLLVCVSNRCDYDNGDYFGRGRFVYELDPGRHEERTEYEHFGFVPSDD